MTLPSSDPAFYTVIQGERVPSLGLGTWQLRGAACRQAVEHALDLGYRHLDTAQMYENEDAVGQGLAHAPVDRDAVFLTTKIWHDSLAPADVRRTTEASLRRLGTDYVDLLLIHWPNPHIPLEQTLDAMLALQAEGKTRHIGVSNFPPSLLQRALAHTPLFGIQVEYHPYLGQHRLLRLALAHDLMLTAYSPIAKARVLEDPVLQEIAETHGKTPIQVTLRWLIQQRPVTAIPRSARPSHRAANLDVFDFALSAEEMRRIARLDRGLRLVDPDFAPDWEREDEPADEPAEAVLEAAIGS